MAALDKPPGLHGGNGRAEMGMVLSRALAISGICRGVRVNIARRHLVGGARVIVVSMTHGACNREMVRLPSQQRKLLADHHLRHIRGNGFELSANLCRSIRLHVECVELGRSPLQENDDARLGLSEGGRSATRLFKGSRLTTQQFGQRQPQQAQAADTQQIAAACQGQRAAMRLSAR